HRQPALHLAPPAPLLRQHQDRILHGIPPPASPLERPHSVFLRTPEFLNRRPLPGDLRPGEKAEGRPKLPLAVSVDSTACIVAEPTPAGAPYCALFFVSSTRAAANGSVASSSTGVLAPSLDK